MRKRFHKAAPACYGLILAISAGFAGRAALTLPWWVRERIFIDAEEAVPLMDAGAQGLALVMTVFFAAGAVFLGISAFLAFIRRGWVLAVLRKSFISVYVLFWLYFYALMRITAAYLAADVFFMSRHLDAVTLFFTRWDYLKWPALWTLIVFGCHVGAWCRSVMNLYTGETDETPARGDLLLYNIRTYGADPQYRKSWMTSVSTHLLILVILPFLFQLIGCVTPYRIPKGSGEPVVALVQIVQPKEQPKKEYILRPDSSIYFRVPDLDESDVLREVQEMTLLTYQADPSAMAGRMGRGGGTTGGWPDGMEDHLVRFIRLDYGGPGWDEDMDAINRSELNLLEEFHRQTGFNISDRFEYHPVRLLARYPPGMAPPFVYMTGIGDINITGRDLRILRDYLNDGGMLIVDCGSPRFDRSFRRWANTIFPETTLTTIAHDDQIFQVPYAFPRGAPPLWHHGGRDALGIRLRGRWAVFYHPGDLKNAWRTGHSGLDPQLARSAFNLGINLIYYSFSHYLEQTRHQRRRR